jgi:hypothetical protein
MNLRRHAQRRDQLARQKCNLSVSAFVSLCFNAAGNCNARFGESDLSPQGPPVLIGLGAHPGSLPS